MVDSFENISQTSQVLKVDMHLAAYMVGIRITAELRVSGSGFKL